jgi:arsenite-transporting ATPase
VRDTFGLSKTPLVDIIESWKALAGQVMRFFSDPANVEFLLVTIPEALGVYQSLRVVRDLEGRGLTVRYLIVNDVIVQPDCAFHRQRQEMQRPYIEALRSEYGERMTLVELPLLPYEVKGVERLDEVARILFR